MDAAENKRIVAEIYRRYATGDMDFVLGSLTEDVVWCSPGPPESLPWAGECRGRAGVTGYFSRIGQAAQVERYDVQEIIAEGDRVVVLARAFVHFDATDRRVEFEKVDLLRMRDGKVAEFREFYDTAAALSAACG